MIANLEYIREISDIRYKLKTGIMTKLKDKEKLQAKGQVEMTLDCMTLSRISISIIPSFI